MASLPADVGQIGAHLVEGAGGDPGAVAQPRHQLAVVDHEPPEGRFRGLGLAAIIPDFTEYLIGGGGRVALAFLGPHGCLLRLSLDSNQAASVRWRQPQS